MDLPSFPQEATISALPSSWSLDFLFLKKHHVLFALELAVFAWMGIFLAMAVYATTGALLFSPKLTLASTESLLNNSEPIVLNFDHPFATGDIKYSIIPAAKGEWKFSKPLFLGQLYQELEFVPSETLNPDTTYTIAVQNLHSQINFGKSEALQVKVKTLPLPTIAAVKPPNNFSSLHPRDQIEVYLTSPNDMVANFEFSFNPTLKFSSSLTDDKRSYLIKPLENLKQGQSYTLTITEEAVRYNLQTKQPVFKSDAILASKINYTTLPGPQVTFSASGSSALTGPITVSFNKEMDQSSVTKGLSFQPEFAKNLQWVDKKTLVIIPTPNLSFNTNYSVILAAGITALDGTSFESTVVNNFTTVGNVKVIAFVPANGSSGVSVKSGLGVVFDQPVDHQSAQEHFSITPSISGTFSWSGNTMSFLPSSLAYSTTYNLFVSKGIKSLTALDGAADFKSSFRTTDLIETVVLNVPRYAQKYTLSCEFANMRMALAYRGVTKSEDELIAETPFDNTPHVGNTWGDPSVGFVGNVNGTYFGDGYGAYSPVVSGELAKYRTVETHTNWDIASLAAEIKAGNPVIIWGCTYCIGPVYWNTPAGKQVYAYQYYHMYTVVGYVGTSNNPTSLIVNNSVSGTQQTLSKSTFLGKWAALGNTAVVVK